MGCAHKIWLLALTRLLLPILSVFHLNNFKRNFVQLQTSNFWNKAKRKNSMSSFTMFSSLKMTTTSFTQRRKLTIFQSKLHRLPKLLHVTILKRHREVMLYSMLKKEMVKTRNAMLLMATNSMSAMRSLEITRCQNTISRLPPMWQIS